MDRFYAITMLCDFAILIPILLLAQQASASVFGRSSSFKSREIIYIDRPYDEEHAIHKLCSDPTHRISRISTIAKLLRQFEAPNFEPRDCAHLYLEPLRSLNRVVSSQVDNVCGLDKVKLVDEFHWDYQLGAINNNRLKFAKGQLPEPLKVFFLHYVTEITGSCKDNLQSSRAQLSSALTRDLGLDKSSDFGGIVDKFQQVLVPMKKIKHFGDFVLLWDMMINHERKKDKDIRPIDSDESVISLIKVKDASRVWGAQRKCRQRLRPVYRNSVLPMMKLIDMGYGLAGKHFGDEMKGNIELKTWYSLTQTCELLLPMRFYEDKLMKFWEMGTLDSMEAASGFTEEPAASTEPSMQVDFPAISLSDELSSTLNSDETQLLKSVKSNAAKRGHLYRKFMRNALASTFSKSFSGYRQVLSLLKKKKQHPASDEEIMKDTEKFLEDDEKLDDETSHVSRPKREVDEKEEKAQIEEKATRGIVDGGQVLSDAKIRRMKLESRIAGVIYVVVIVLCVLGGLGFFG